MRTKGFSLLGAVLLGFLLLMPASAQAADPTPSPTLGSTASPNPNPPGAQDADANDFQGATWVVIGAAVVIVLVAGGTFLTFRNRRRTRPVDHAGPGNRSHP